MMLVEIYDDVFVNPEDIESIHPSRRKRGITIQMRSGREVTMYGDDRQVARVIRAVLNALEGTGE